MNNKKGVQLCFSRLLWILYLWHKMADNKLPICGIMGNTYLIKRGALWLVHIVYIIEKVKDTSIA